MVKGGVQEVLEDVVVAYRYFKVLSRHSLKVLRTIPKEICLYSKRVSPKYT
jgi:hypothetical protein